MPLTPLAAITSTERADRTAPSGSAERVETASEAETFSDVMGATAKSSETDQARFFHQSSRSAELKPLQRFESFVLRSFVENMMPKDNTSFFGSGTAGEIWKSMLAEKIGDEMAAGGGIGIADMLADKAPAGVGETTK